MQKMYPQKLGVPVEFQNSCIENLNFRDNEFDIILSCFALSYVENLKIVFKEIRKIIKKPGIFVFSLEHPFITNMSKENFVTFQNNTYPLTKDYFQTGKKDNFWLSGKVSASLITYKRKIEDIINPLIESGFRLAKIIEPSDYDIKNIENDEKNNIPYIPGEKGRICKANKFLPYTLIIKATNI